MKLGYISEIAGLLYCGIVEWFTGLGSDLHYGVICCILRCTVRHIRSPNMWRRNFPNRYAVNGGTDATGVDPVLPMDAIVMPNEIAVPDEGSATQSTLEILACRMRPNVDCELGLAGEGH